MRAQVTERPRRRAATCVEGIINQAAALVDSDHLGEEALVVQFVPGGDRRWRVLDDGALAEIDAATTDVDAGPHDQPVDLRVGASAERAAQGGLDGGRHVSGFT